MTAPALLSTRHGLAAVGILLTLLGTAACGSDDDSGGSFLDGEGGSAADDGTGGGSDGGTDSAEGYALPDHFPLDSFSVPPGADTGNAGSTSEDSVSILIMDIPSNEVLTFYQEELAGEGYELMPDLEDGVLGFSGNGVEGSVIAPGGDGGIVTVRIG
jgi:hypothetical protein